MTRLVESWIRDIGSNMPIYNSELKVKTGLDLAAIAERSAGVAAGAMADFARCAKVAVIPISTGQGIIGSFAEATSAITSFLGFDSFVTGGTDVAGILEARRNEARILLLADDNRFIALDLKTGSVAENSSCTARGYVAALEGAAGSLAGREVLVIGCGEVGCEMLSILREKNAVPVAYDNNREILDRVGQTGFGSIDKADLIAGYDLILDASSQGGWLTCAMLKEDVLIAAPGVPLSLDDEAFMFHRHNLIHDLLPIGVAAMLAELSRG